MKNNLIPILATSVVLLASCGKDYKKAPEPELNVETSIDSMKPAASTFTLTSESGGSFVSNGVRYEFPPNMFVNSSGGTVSGKIEVSTTEFLNATTMIPSRVLPIGSGNALVSGGEFYVMAKQNGKELSFAPNKLYKINVKRNDTLSMDMFIGKVDSGANGKINWQLNTDSSQGYAAVTNDSIILTTRSSFTNADRFLTGNSSSITNPSSNPRPVIRLSDYPYQSITISLYSTEGLGDEKEIHAYAIYGNFNSVWPLNNISMGKITEGKLHKMPLRIVAMMAHKGFTYGGSIDITPEAGREYKLNMSKMAVNELNRLSR